MKLRRRQPGLRRLQRQHDKYREQTDAELECLRKGLAAALDKIQLMEGADREHRAELKKAFGSWGVRHHTLDGRVVALEQHNANTAAVTVPPGQRDTSDPADQATHPVMTLPEAQQRGLLDLAHIPVGGESTLTLRVPTSPAQPEPEGDVERTQPIEIPAPT